MNMLTRFSLLQWTVENHNSLADTIKSNNAQRSRCFDQIDKNFTWMELRLGTCKEEVGELCAVLDLLSTRLGMLEESSAKKDECIRELELQVEHLNDRDAKVTISLCESDSFLIKHNIHLDEFEQRMEAAMENLQESVQETHSMVEVHYEQSVNWHRSWMDTALSNSNKLIGLDNLYDEMAEYLSEEIHCSHCNDLEDNVFHGIGDCRHPGFSCMVLSSRSPSPIVWTHASSLALQDLLQPSSPSTESGVLGDSSRVEYTSPASTPPPLEEVQPMVVRSPRCDLCLIRASSHSTPYLYHFPGSSSSSMASSVGSRECCVCAGHDSSDHGTVSYDSESKGTAVSWAFIQFAV